MVEGGFHPMTRKDAARIQSAEARAQGGRVQSGGFASRAQRAAARNEPIDYDGNIISSSSSISIDHGIVIVISLLFSLIIIWFSVATGVLVLTPEEKMSFSEMTPYAKIIGVVVMALGIILAFSGKSIMRLYLSIVGCLFGVSTSYITLQRIDLGPSKDIIEIVVAFVGGIIGTGLGLVLSQLVVFALGALFGLVLTLGVLNANVPGIKHIRDTLPVWAIVIVVMALSMLITYFLELYLYVGLTAIVGAFAAAFGLDILLKTGFNQQVLELLTSEEESKMFKLTKEMRPIILCFCSTLVAGSLCQLYLLHRHRHPRYYRGTPRQPLMDEERGHVPARMYT